MNEAEILEALKVVQDPDLNRDIVSLGFVKNIKICEGKVAFDVELTTPACPIKDQLKQQSIDAVKALPGVESVEVTMTSNVRSSLPAAEGSGLAQVKNAIAIASGKGGVGKSTVTVNLAIALARSGAKVGLMDGDVYGPSIPAMLGGGTAPEMAENQITPAEAHGIKYISMGLLAGEGAPVIWRGPMASRMVQQFLSQVTWGELDYLLIDLPPGTGDVQLTLTQSAPLTGAVIVTTPQDVAVDITLRGLAMFEQVHVPILGIIENMSFFQCPHCDGRTDVFRHGGGEKAAERVGTPFLGGVPLDPSLALAGDAGRPIQSEAFDKIAQAVAHRVSVIAAGGGGMHTPKEIDAGAEEITITWLDEIVTRHSYHEMRVNCPCATCKDEWTGKKILDVSTVPKDVHPTQIRKVGRYAIQPTWSDGHSTGIYSFDLLRQMAGQN